MGNIEKHSLLVSISWVAQYSIFRLPCKYLYPFISTMMLKIIQTIYFLNVWLRQRHEKRQWLQRQQQQRQWQQRQRQPRQRQQSSQDHLADLSVTLGIYWEYIVFIQPGGILRASQNFFGTNPGRSPLVLTGLRWDSSSSSLWTPLSSFSSSSLSSLSSN